jgi:hypothetical protein
MWTEHALDACEMQNIYNTTPFKLLDNTYLSMAYMYVPNFIFWWIVLEDYLLF